VPGSCKKEPICACGVEHPEENLPWLKTILDVTIKANIYQVLFEGSEYIVVSDLQVPDAIQVVYNCLGIKLCENGGINPGGNLCNLKNPEIFWPFFDRNKVLIYECRNVPD
jgi:hypothetical protein